MKSIIFAALLVAAVSANSNGLFGWTYEMCFDEIYFSNSQGPRLTLLGYAGPSQILNDLVLIASNKKHGAETTEVEIAHLGVHFSCADESTSFDDENELDSFTDPDSGKSFQYTQEWCHKQQEKWEEWASSNVPWWPYQEDPAGWLCCFAKNWKGPNIHHPSPEVNEHDALKNTGPGGNPNIYIAAKYNDVEIQCDAQYRRTITTEDGETRTYCYMGKGKGSSSDYPCISFTGNLNGHNGHCDGSGDICNNHVQAGEQNGHVYVQLGGDGVTFSCYDIDVVLVLSNNEKLTHTVTADDVVMHQVISLNGQALFLKSGHHGEPTGNGGDGTPGAADSNRCQIMSQIEGGECADTELSCGGARCGFGGDPQIYYRDCDNEDGGPLRYLTNCNHASHSPHDLNPCSEGSTTYQHWDTEDNCVCRGCDRRRSVFNVTRGAAPYEPCPGWSGGRFGVREALEVHKLGMRQPEATTTTAENSFASVEKPVLFI